MIRELILVSADLKATPWFATGSAPRPELPAGLTLTEARDAAAFPLEPVAPDLARARLKEGDRCITAQDAGGKIIGQMWLAQKPRRLEWIGCDVPPAADSVLLYNAWVEPAQRGRGVHWAMASRACEIAVGMGLPKISAGLDRHEFQPFAHKYAEMGLAVIVPTASLWCMPSTGWKVTLKPPRLLVDLSKGLACA